MVTKSKLLFRFTLHPKHTNPIQRTEKSLKLKLASNVTKGSKIDRRCLWDAFAPGSVVTRTSPTATVIREPGAPEVRVINKDFAKFGTKVEQNTPLWQYAQRRTLPYEKTTEQKIAQHTKDLEKKQRDDTKIRQGHAVNLLGISSAKSKNSNAMTARKSFKPQTLVNSAPSTLTPSTSTGKSTRRAPTYYGFEIFVCLVSESESILVLKRQRTKLTVIATIIQEEYAHPPTEVTNFELPMVSPPDPKSGQPPLPSRIMTFRTMNERSNCLYLTEKLKYKKTQTL